MLLPRPTCLLQDYRSLWPNEHSSRTTFDPCPTAAESPSMKVRSNGTYLYQPCLWDLVDPKTPLTANALVTVVKLDGCPPPNTMGHAHIADMQGQFLGLVSTTSLHELTAQQKAASNRAKRKANGGRFMTGAEISELIDLQGKCSYNLPNKQLFRKLATK